MSLVVLFIFLLFHSILCQIILPCQEGWIWSLKQDKKDNKLSPKYYGPYKMLHKIGTMAYKLEFPAYSRVHPVFHVSWLNKVIDDKIPV